MTPRQVLQDLKKLHLLPAEIAYRYKTHHLNEQLQQTLGVGVRVIGVTLSPIKSVFQVGAGKLDILNTQTAQIAIVQGHNGRLPQQTRQQEMLQGMDRDGGLLLKLGVVKRLPLGLLEISTQFQSRAIIAPQLPGNPQTAQTSLNRPVLTGWLGQSRTGMGPPPHHLPGFATGPLTEFVARDKHQSPNRALLENVIESIGQGLRLAHPGQRAQQNPPLPPGFPLLPVVPQKRFQSPLLNLAGLLQRQSRAPNPGSQSLSILQKPGPIALDQIGLQGGPPTGQQKIVQTLMLRNPPGQPDRDPGPSRSLSHQVAGLGHRRLVPPIAIQGDDQLLQLPPLDQLLHSRHKVPQSVHTRQRQHNL